MQSTAAAKPNFAHVARGACRRATAQRPALAATALDRGRAACHAPRQPVEPDPRSGPRQLLHDVAAPVALPRPARYRDAASPIDWLHAPGERPPINVGDAHPVLHPGRPSRCRDRRASRATTPRPLPRAARRCSAALDPHARQACGGDRALSHRRPATSWTGRPRRDRGARSQQTRATLLDALVVTWKATNDEMTAPARCARATASSCACGCIWAPRSCCCGLLLTAVFFVARQIARPLRHLADVADRVSRTGDYTLRAHWEQRGRDRPAGARLQRHARQARSQSPRPAGARAPARAPRRRSRTWSTRFPFRSW